MINEITDTHHFTDVPEDWCALLTDVVASTTAIESGHYRDVNTIGAAGIVAVKNALKGIDFPYVFGGDGASIIVPGSKAKAALTALAPLKQLAKQKFSLELRIFSIDVSEIARAGHLIQVAKYEIVPGMGIGMFRGGGLKYAETLMKIKGAGKSVDPPQSRESVDLSGLSCRWNSIPSKQGCVLSLIATAEGEHRDTVYADLLAKLNEIAPDTNPVNTDLMSYRSLADIVKSENRYHTNFSIKKLFRNLEILVAALVFRYRAPSLFFNKRKYIESIRAHSDHVKFSDSLQMIIDCSPAQRDQIIEYLTESRKRGELNFGLHESKTSLMTCYVNGLDDGNHIHFIDGGDGGYAMAAKQLKSSE